MVTIRACHSDTRQYDTEQLEDPEICHKFEVVTHNRFSALMQSMSDEKQHGMAWNITQDTRKEKEKNRRNHGSVMKSWAWQKRNVQPDKDMTQVIQGISS